MDWFLYDKDLRHETVSNTELELKKTLLKKMHIDYFRKAICFY